MPRRQYKTPEEADLRIINVLWLKGSGTVEVILDFLFHQHPLASSDLDLSSGSTEMQVPEVAFVDQASAGLWASIVEKKVNLVPYSTCTSEHRRELEDRIRQHYKITGPLAFLHVNLIDSRSQFSAPLRMRSCAKQKTL